MVRYKTIDEWNYKFLQATIKKLLCSIKSGGYLLVNISDVYASSGAKQKKMGTNGKYWLEICNPMNDFVSTFTDSEYQGCIGMEMAKRPNSGGAGTAAEDRFKDETRELAEQTKDKTFCEPIWIWKKL